MIKSFFKITFRLLWRNKITSLINISSLTFGIAAFVLIMIYVHHESRFDRFNENYDRIYRVEADNYGKLAPLMGEYLINKVPEIERLARIGGFGIAQNFKFVDENDPTISNTIRGKWFYADSTVFEVFTFPLLIGNPKTALSMPFTAVISETLARNIFGNENEIRSH